MNNLDLQEITICPFPDSIRTDDARFRDLCNTLNSVEETNDETESGRQVYGERPRRMHLYPHF